MSDGDTLLTGATGETGEGAAGTGAGSEHGSVTATGANADAGTPGAGTDGKTGEEKQPGGAPEKYEFKAPEGSEFDPGVIDVFSGAAKDLNLTQDQAQMLLDKVGPAIQSQQMERIAQVQNEWAEAARGDEEFGGANLDQNLAVAKKAMDAFSTPALRELMNASGLGNHPEVIRTFYRVGKAISEDGFVSGDGGKTNQNDARNMYSASNMNP